MAHRSAVKACGLAESAGADFSSSRIQPVSGRAVFLLLRMWNGVTRDTDRAGSAHVALGVGMRGGDERAQIPCITPGKKERND